MPDPTLQYIKDGGLLGAFSLFLWFMWRSQQAFLDCLLKFRETMDTMLNKCDK